MSTVPPPLVADLSYTLLYTYTRTSSCKYIVFLAEGDYRHLSCYKIRINLFTEIINYTELYHVILPIFQQIYPINIDVLR